MWFGQSIKHFWNIVYFVGCVGALVWLVTIQSWSTCVTCHNTVLEHLCDMPQYCVGTLVWRVITQCWNTCVTCHNTVLERACHLSCNNTVLEHLRRYVTILTICSYWSIPETSYHITRFQEVVRTLLKWLFKSHGVYLFFLANYLIEFAYT